MTRKTSALDLINRLGQAESALHGQEFLAPLVRHGRARLRLQGLVYEFTVTNAQAGWWICRVLNARQSECVETALPWQRGDYLARWPVLRLVLLEPLSDGTWLALPFNPSDAAQRFNLAGPQLMYLVEQGQPFERVLGRVEGRTIWYDEHDRRGDPLIAEALRNALAAGQTHPGIAHLSAGEQAAYALRFNQPDETPVLSEEERTEQQVRHALEIGGARLLGYAVTDHGLRISWERDGQRSVTLVDQNMHVVTAGICLSGQDRRFDLASIVSVVRDSPAFAQFDDDE